MTTVPTTRPAHRSRPAAAGRTATLAGAVLCLAVAAIHVQDQGGLTALKSPAYVGYGYWLVEVAGLVAAVLLLTRRAVRGWVLALGVAAGPLVGYVLSRGPGLPGYTEDVGNWGEPLGVVSLVVEGVLLVLAAWALATTRRRRA